MSTYYTVFLLKYLQSSMQKLRAWSPWNQISDPRKSDTFGHTDSELKKEIVFFDAQKPPLRRPGMCKLPRRIGCSIPSRLRRNNCLLLLKLILLSILKLAYASPACVCCAPLTTASWCSELRRFETQAYAGICIQKR